MNDHIFLPKSLQSRSVKKHYDYRDGMNFIVRNSDVEMKLYFLISEFTLFLKSQIQAMGEIFILLI